MSPTFTYAGIGPISTCHARGNIYKRHVFHSGGAKMVSASSARHVRPINRWNDKVSIWKGWLRALSRTRRQNILYEATPALFLPLSPPPLPFLSIRQCCKLIVTCVSKLCGGNFNFGPVLSMRRNCEIPQPYFHIFLSRRLKI